MSAAATIHIGPDDDAIAILDALGKWLRRTDGRRAEVTSTWRGFRVVLHGAVGERGTWPSGTLIASSACSDYVESALADALNEAEEGDDHAA